MAYVDLTAEQKQNLQDFINGILRPWSGEQARTNNHGDAGDVTYNSTILTILTELLDADVIPNDGSGLAGAVGLTKAEVVSIVAHWQGILTSFNTAAHRQLWAKAAGGVNLIG